MRIAFLGTPDFAVTCLAELVASGHEIVAVYSQPPAPRGRGHELKPSPVHAFAEGLGLPVRTPVSMKTPEEIEAFQALDLDAAVVVAFGQILVKAVLDAPRYGCFNLHASLLPRWRGAAPIQRAILAGESESGVDLMQMEAGLDTGPILLERRTPIASDETGGSLHDRLAALGADVLAEGLARIAQGESLRPHLQAEAGVTYAHKIDKSEARLDWDESAIALERKVRAFNPWPIAEAVIQGERLRIWSAQALATRADAPPGTILESARDSLDVAAADGVLRINEVQREGGRRVSVRDWNNARRERGART